MEQQVSGKTTVSWREYTGWLLTNIVPVAVYLYTQKAGFNRESSIFAAVVSVTLVMWITEILPDFVPGLFSTLMFILFSLAPNEVILSGFASEGFFLAVSVLGLGTVIVTSGLSHRYSLMMLKIMPPNTFWYQISLFFTGLIFTPLVPVISGRAAIVAPVLNEIVTHSYNGLDLDERTMARSKTALFASSLIGITLLSASFLSSTPLNLIVYGMLPLQEQQSFQFIKWSYASLVVSGTMLISFFIILALYLRSFHKLNVNKDFINDELVKMGRLKVVEWIAVFGIVVLAAGMFAATITKISVTWVAFAIMFALLFVGVLNPNDFRTKIDWSFLFLLGSMIGLVNTMNYLKIDLIVVKNLGWLANYMHSDFRQFIVLIALTIFVVRIIIPMNAVVLIFAATLLPLAKASGISTWLTGFLILFFAETAVFPFQAPYLSNFRNATKAVVNQQERSVSVVNLLLFFVKVAAIYLSIPFWTMIGVL
ncbi:SLC13 family permease [Candidatus Magnetominusculus xianensis]|uniref:Sodium/sulfate symporter n=1 Tax=Candidatus Magnetominusculus xianensis TaxID=1748249 RepID=A0ABR5SCD2_9BACT|nr:SLC13 family permease [Candidatus Magnetominusculus xianensis]KWT79699.1 sodium/sulfate symporter [Candidatus Magnetominusculus xianensis]MBF0404761.1 anion permease [Nitrospirota bacterium]